MAGPAVLAAPPAGPVADDEATWAQLDTTGNGLLSGTELANGAWLKFDANRDGRVTKAEFLDGRARERSAPRLRLFDRPPAAAPARPAAVAPPAPGVTRPATPAVPAVPAARPAPAADRRTPVAEPTIIEAHWGDRWWKAHIIEKSVDPENPGKGVRHKIHYEGSGSDSDEWVDADKLRTTDGTPLPAPTPTADDLAAAAREAMTGTDYFVGTWALSGVPVWNVVKREKLDDGKTVRETTKMGGGGERGIVRINADGTYVVIPAAGRKSSGHWHVNKDKARPGDLVLSRAERGDDLYVHRARGGTISVRGDVSSRGFLVKDDAGMVVVAKVGIEFFHGEWRLSRRRSSTLLKSDYGLLTINADGTFTHTDAGVTTKGKWTKQAEDIIVVHEPWKEGDFRFEQEGATDTISAQGVQQTHISIYARRPDGK